MIDRYNPNNRYRNRAKDRLMSMISFLMMFVLALGIGYWFGRQGSAAKLDAQTRQIELLDQETRTLQEKMTAAQTEAQTATLRYDQLRKDMEDLVPTQGPLRELLDLVKLRLKEGTNPERLSFVIKSAQPPRNCTDPETKRFVVSTPTYKGSDSTISIDDGLIVVTAKGESAQTKDGQAEAWYDPGQPVSLEFQKHGGETEKKDGVLPLSSSFVVQDREYRFTISSGAKSFIKVTYDSCDYP